MAVAEQRHTRGGAVSHCTAAVELGTPNAERATAACLVATQDEVERSIVVHDTL